MVKCILNGNSINKRRCLINSSLTRAHLPALTPFEPHGTLKSLTLCSIIDISSSTVKLSTLFNF